jgi:psiF repeat
MGETMKKLFAALCMTLPLAAAPALAQGKVTQQNKMKQCAAEAKGKTGDVRKAFMKECLSSGKAAESTKPVKVADVSKTPMRQQDKMKLCAAEGKGKTGDEHKAFMKECLSK